MHTMCAGCFKYQVIFYKYNLFIVYKKFWPRNIKHGVVAGVVVVVVPGDVAGTGIKSCCCNGGCGGWSSS